MLLLVLLIILKSSADTGPPWFPSPIYLPVYFYIVFMRSSKVPPLRNSFRKSSSVSFLCEHVLFQNRLHVPW